VLEVLSVNGPGRVRRRRFFLWLAPVMLASIAVPAARGEAAEQTVSPTTVAEGLKTIQHSGEEVAEYAGQDKVKAQKYAAEVEPVWGLIEDTIRANDKDAYVAFEDAIEGLEAAATAGDAKKAEEASGALTKTAQAYLAKFPADAAAAKSAPEAKQSPVPDAPAPAPAPVPAESRTAAAAPAPAAPAPAAGDAALARTGSLSTALAALAGLAFALGGLAVIGGARRRPAPLA
jgi:pyruvate dehydrogenase E2 component (dihydrolipoyllysine-residue acetyltransferase)